LYRASFVISFKNRIGDFFTGNADSFGRSRSIRNSSLSPDIDCDADDDDEGELSVIATKIDKDLLFDADRALPANYVDNHLPDDFVARSLSLSAGTSALIVNGRVLPLSLLSSTSTVPSSSLVWELSLLDSVTSVQQQGNNIVHIVEGAAFTGFDSDELTSTFYSDRVMLAAFAVARRITVSAALAAKSQQAASGAILPNHPAGMPIVTAIISSSNNSSATAQLPALVRVRAVLDPLSTAAQRITPMLLALRDAFTHDFTIFLNPKTGFNELPLKRFYVHPSRTNAIFGLVSFIFNIFSRVFYFSAMLSRLR
jgi:hypothetical protein